MIDRIGFHDFVLTPVLADTEQRYETGKILTLDKKGTIERHRDESMPDSFYDCYPFSEMSQFVYRLVDIRINALSLQYLKFIGFIQPTNGISVLEPAPATLHTPYSIRFVVDCVDGSKFYFKFRVFSPSSVRFDNFVTTHNVTSCDLTLTGLFKLPAMPKLHAFDIMHLTPDGANDLQTSKDCYDFLTKPEGIDVP